MPLILRSILEVIWFFLPGFAANMAPVFAARYHWLPSLKLPLDARYTLGNDRILGNNKTVRGLVVGLIAGTLVGMGQYLVVRGLGVGATSLFSYSSLITSMALGYWLGLGALLGDIIKSFLKRRVTIPAGESWIPWDQIDIVIGMLLMTAWIIPFSLIHIVSAFVIVGGGMFVVSVLGFRLRIKKAV